MRCITSQAICAHSSSDSILSRGQRAPSSATPAAANPHVPIAACGWFSSPSQPPEIPPAVLAQRRLQLGGVPPPGDDVRVGVLLVPPGAVQVVDQRLDALSARRADLPYHRNAFPDFTARPSGLAECIPRVRNAFRLSPKSLPDFFRDRIEAFPAPEALRGVRDEITRTLTGRIQLRYRLVKVHPDPAHQPGRAHKLPEQFMEEGVLRTPDIES